MSHISWNNHALHTDTSISNVIALLPPASKVFNASEHLLNTPQIGSAKKIITQTYDPLFDAASKIDFPSYELNAAAIYIEKDILYSGMQFVPLHTGSIGSVTAVLYSRTGTLLASGSINSFGVPNRVHNIDFTVPYTPTVSQVAMIGLIKNTSGNVMEIKAILAYPSVFHPAVANQFDRRSFQLAEVSPTAPPATLTGTPAQLRSYMLWLALY